MVRQQPDQTHCLPANLQPISAVAPMQQAPTAAAPASSYEAMEAAPLSKESMSLSGMSGIGGGHSNNYSRPSGQNVGSVGGHSGRGGMDGGRKVGKVCVRELRVPASGLPRFHV